MAKAPDAERDVAEMRERIALANERPDAQNFHGREQAMFALASTTTPRARSSSRAATSSSSANRSTCWCSPRPPGRAAIRRRSTKRAELKSSIGLHDRRIDALL